MTRALPEGGGVIEQGVSHPWYRPMRRVIPCMSPWRCRWWCKQLPAVPRFACCPQVCLLTAEDVEMPGLTRML